MAEPTVLSSWARTILEVLEARSIDTRALLQSEGLDPTMLLEPNGRVPARAMAHLWRRAAELVGEPAIGLRVSKYVRHTTFHALGYSVLASSTMGEALDRIVRYNQMVSDALLYRVERESGQRRLVIEVPLSQGVPIDEAMDATLSLLVRTFRILAGSDFPLVRVDLARAAPADPGPYHRFFRCPVVFASINALTIAESGLDLPLASGNPELARHNDAAVREYLGRIAEGTLPDRARAAIAKNVQYEISPEKVAKQLGMSLRSLQRGLRAADTSYERLLRETRHELAATYLRAGKHAIGEIAFLLGYESVAAFAQAFKRWTGVAPSEFVKRSGAAD